MPSNGEALTRQAALTDEQRREAIQKLLEERRSRRRDIEAGVSAPEQRALRARQLIQERAAARRDEQLARQSYGDTDLQYQPSTDALLSPGSSCSLASLPVSRRERERSLLQLSALQPLKFPSSSQAPKNQQQPWSEFLGSNVHPVAPLTHDKSRSAEVQMRQQLQDSAAWLLSTCTSPDRDAHAAADVPADQQHALVAQQWQANCGAAARMSPSPQQQRAALPPGYPEDGEQRLQQLAQPRSLSHGRYEELRREAERAALQDCSFAPRIGRPPQHSTGPDGLPVSERLYAAAAERAARQARRAAEAAAAVTQDCTFKPCTNSSDAGAVHLAAYDYAPLHERVGDVLRSRSERLAQLQEEAERAAAGAAPFTPRINQRSVRLAARRGDRGSAGLVHDSHGSSDQHCTAGRHSSSRDGGDKCMLRRSRSEADLRQPATQDCASTKTPRASAASDALLRASEDIPSSFLQRQAYFARLAQEKRQLLALALEDEHCAFNPSATPSVGGTNARSSAWCSDSGCSESYLERIERLAYADARALQASRAALAEMLHSAECTFCPVINAHSARMAQATPLQELHENSRGRLRRGAVALALQQERAAECTFTPNLAKRSPPQQATPPEAMRSLSASEVEAVVERLARPRPRDEPGPPALSLSQYQELRQCTFTPAITRGVPKEAGPVLVRGLGRFMELKAMARRQTEQRAAAEARAFLEHIGTDTPTGTRSGRMAATVTVPQPFRLSGRRESGATAPQISRSSNGSGSSSAPRSSCAADGKGQQRSRQQRIARLLQQHRDDDEAAAGAAGRSGP